MLSTPMTRPDVKIKTVRERTSVPASSPESRPSSCRRSDSSPPSGCSGTAACSPVDLVLLAGFYVACGLGITVGFHRLFTHKSFETSAPLRALWAILGSMAMQGPLTQWHTDHRKHHALSDRPGDPHSPHAGAWRVAGRARARALAPHIGRLFSTKGLERGVEYGREGGESEHRLQEERDDEDESELAEPTPGSCSPPSPQEHSSPAASPRLSPAESDRTGLTSVILADVPRAQSGEGSGIQSTSRQRSAEKVRPTATMPTTSIARPSCTTRRRRRVAGRTARRGAVGTITGSAQ